MQTPFIVGSGVYLRPLRRDDLNDSYLAWLNDAEVTRYLESGTFPYSHDELERFYSYVSGSNNQVLLAVVDRESERHIGNVKLGPINWVHRKATFGIMIGDKTCWGRGIGTAATRMMVEYGFFRLNLHRIDLGVYADHAAAVRAYQRVGFQIEGRLREDMFHDGVYTDRLLMALLRTEYLQEQQ